MDRSRTSQRRVLIQTGGRGGRDGDDEEEQTLGRGGGMRFQASREDQEPFMGVKARRITSLHRDCKGDYLDVPSHPFLLKILQKQENLGIIGARAIFQDAHTRFAAAER